MLAALSPDMLATDLAYYLARKGVGIYFRGILRFTPVFEWQNWIAFLRTEFLFYYDYCVVKPIEKRSDEVTKIMNLWDRFVYSEKKKDERCPFANNEPVDANLLGDLSSDDSI